MCIIFVCFADVIFRFALINTVWCYFCLSNPSFSFGSNKRIVVKTIIYNIFVFQLSVSCYFDATAILFRLTLYFNIYIWCVILKSQLWSQITVPFSCSFHPFVLSASSNHMYLLILTLPTSSYFNYLLVVIFQRTWFLSLLLFLSTSNLPHVSFEAYEIILNCPDSLVFAVLSPNFF